MALSKRKTTIAVLRGILGPIHGQEDRFAKLAGRSRSWVKKASAGGILRLSEERARVLELETGISLAWLLGPPDAAPVDRARRSYTFARFESHRASIKSGNPPIAHAGFPFAFAPHIFAIGAAASTRQRAGVFTFRLNSFLEKCSAEFGLDRKAFATAVSMLSKCPELCRLGFCDKGMDLRRLGQEVKKSMDAAAKRARARGFRAVARPKRRR